MSAALAAQALDAGYNGHPVVHGLDLEVLPGQVVALLGPNGAGKTTTMLTLAGDLAALGGEVRLHGEPVRSPLHRRAKQGLALVTEERSVFMQLSVADNLRLGRCSRKLALSLFPELEPLLRRRAGLLSGGEQQMLTLARALAREPKVLLADELSLGLAPLLVGRLLQAVRQAADERGVAVLLVEQHVKQVLRVADRAYVMQRGHVAVSGTADEVRERMADVEETYIAQGVGAPG